MLTINLIHLVFLVVSVASYPPKEFEKVSVELLEEPKAIKTFADETDEYRLPTGIIGGHQYFLSLNVPTDIFENHIFNGTLNLVFQVWEETNELKLHTNEITFTSVTITDWDVPLTPPTNTYNENTEITTFTINEGLIPDHTYVLTIEYTGRLRDDDLQGFYQSSYNTSTGEQKFLATTQFQTTFARAAFPCFDEPSFKAKFDITIRHPAKYSARANTIGRSIIDPNDSDYNITTFVSTPAMSTYLIAFIISEFTCSPGEDIHAGVPYHICSQSETDDIRDVALDVGPKILWSLEDFTNIAYSMSGIGKMDQFAIPDFNAGAMENWGIATYREIYLLWDPVESTNLYKQYVETIVAHEFSHMWFGDLVTTHWWSDTFLNEGWATYFEFFTTAEIEPVWELDRQFIIRVVQPALASDASPNSLPLSYPVSTPDEVDSRFSTVSYSKGGSIFRMVEHFMGTEQFKLGVKRYMDYNAFGNVVPKSLWDAFAPFVLPGKLPPNVDLHTVVANWVEEAGYPLLQVSASGRTVTIHQHRFLTSGIPPADLNWYVPVSYATPNDPDNVDTSTKQWLLPGVDLVLTDVLGSENDWIVLNNGAAGFYRVNYDSNLWSRLIEVLNQPGFGGISVLNRAQIVDDIYNFARYGNEPYARFFTVIGFLKKDTSYYSWYPAFTAINYLLPRIGNNNLKRIVTDYILDLMEILYNSLPFEEPKNDNHIYTLNRVQAINWACRLGLSDCVIKAKAALQEYRRTQIKPDKNLRGQIYCNGLRYSDDISNDWNFLFARYQETSSVIEHSVLFSALGCPSDTTTLNEFLTKSITPNSGIRPGDNLDVFASVYNGNHENGTDIALSFLIDNFSAIDQFYAGTSNVLSLISYLATRFARSDQADKLELFINDRLTGNQQAYARQYLASARTNLETIATFENDLFGHFVIQPQQSSAETIKFSVIMTSLMLLCYKIFY